MFSSLFWRCLASLSKSNMISIQQKNLNNKIKSSTIKSNFVSEISIVNSSTYLCVLLDNYLMFEPHSKMLTKKLSKAIGILNKVKTYLNKPALLSL